MPRVALPTTPLGWLTMLAAATVGFLAGYLFLRVLGAWL